MKQYHDALQTILKEGVRVEDRTGTGTLSYFGMQCRYDLRDGFPLVTTKKLHLKSIIYELLWFLAGDTNIKYLQENGVSIWDEWADENGDLGPVYGKQWRHFRGVASSDADSAFTPIEVDQIKRLVDDIRDTPNSRRLVVSAWNPVDVPDMALPPCHTLWQVQILDGHLNLQLYQRSADMFLGVPFNIASYSLLLCMLAHVTGYKPGTFVHTIGDAHIYLNHLEQVNTQLSREHRPLPKLEILRDVKALDEFQYKDFAFHDYDPHPIIKAPVAI